MIFYPREDVFVELLKENYVLLVVAFHHPLRLGTAPVHILPKLHSLVMELRSKPKLLTNKV